MEETWPEVRAPMLRALRRLNAWPPAESPQDESGLPRESNTGSSPATGHTGADPEPWVVDPEDQISPERWAELQAGPERRRAEAADRQEAAAERRRLLEQWSAEHPGPLAPNRVHDPIGALVDRLREKWSYIDLDNMRDEGDWRELVEDMIMIIDEYREP